MTSQILIFLQSELCLTTQISLFLFLKSDVSGRFDPGVKALEMPFKGRVRLTS